jgi:hypothetical protein
MGHEHKVAAVGFTGCERCYWLTDAAGDVVMVPAFMLEPEHD